jgi:aminoglycoside phosphotransferase
MLSAHADIVGAWSHHVRVTEDLVARALAMLGRLAAPGDVTRIDAGAGVSAVFGLRDGGRHLVLQVTTVRRALAGARREMAVYTCPPVDLGVAVPVAVGAAERPGMVCLLLAALDPYPPAARVTRDAWLAVAADLGRLHRVPAAAWPGLRPRKPPAPSRIVAGLAVWRQLAGDAVADRAGELLAAAPVPRSTVVVHGDCHVGNLLRDGDATVWIDWLDMRAGTGAEDLALLWQRAEFDGGRPPRAAMLDVYLRHRGDLEVPVFRRALAAEEVRLLAVDWPRFLASGPPARRSELVDLMRRLTATG